MAIKNTSNEPVLDFEAEFIQHDPNRSHFESLGGQFPKHGLQMRRGLMKMFWITFGRYVPHSGYEGVLDFEGSFPSTWLKKNIRDKGYHSVVAPYYERSTNFSIKKKQARKWALKPEIDEILLKIFGSDTPAKLTFKELPPLCQLLTPLDSRIRVQSHIPVEPARLDERLEQLAASIRKAKANRARLTTDGWVEDLIQKRNRLLILRKVIVSVTPKNHVPNIYQRTDYGRICGIGCNLQYLPKADRFHLLHGRNFYDYDFILCHPTIFYGLMRKLNVTAGAIKNYLDRRADVVQEIKSAINLDDAKVKTILNVLIYTNNPSTPYGNIRDLCRSDERFKQLESIPVYQKLREEYRLGREMIVDHYTIGDITTSPTGRQVAEASQGSRLSLILQSIESEMLEYACENFDDTVSLHFDGWISPKRDLEKLTTHINLSISKRIGIDLEMKLKEIAI